MAVLTDVASSPASSAPERIINRTKFSKREALAGYLFISPWIIGFLVFTLGAMIYSLVLSFTNYDLATNTADPVGFANYTRLIDDPKVMLSLGNTLFYAIMAVPLEIMFALFLASLLDKATRGAGLFRVIYYLPKMTPSVATASIFLLLLNGNQGAINKFLGIFGIEGPQWLIDPNWVKPSIGLMAMWTVSGTMLIFLAALKNVPTDLYEAASIDGAGSIRKFFRITLPMISNAMFFCVIVLTIAALQVFDQAYLLYFRDTAQASPDAALFIGVYLFQQAFQQFNMGFAAAIAWLLFVIIMIVTVIQVKFGNKFVYYEGD
jgi:multiple sugar transport system permease protein